MRLERRGALGLITLDRQRALNALTHEMVTTVADALRQWADDTRVERVAITGAGERGLCAGGDVVAIADAIGGGDGEGGEAARFWRDEYAMNAQIARFPKPIVAVQHGIVLGGGVGISGHASHRVVTETTRIGFPEVTIGFVPDVGATWLLSRAPGELGTWAALTGEHVGAADALLLGLADAHVPQERLPELLVLLEAVEPDAAIARLATEPAPGRLAGERALIDVAFAGDDVTGIVAALRASATERGTAIADTIESRSPTAVTIALAALRHARALPHLEAALAQELRTSLHVARQPDFAEGVRAQLVEKDRSPRWRPPALADVPHAMVAAPFEPVPVRDPTLPRPPSGGHR